jgi:hypothetical protein
VRDDTVIASKLPAFAVCLEVIKEFLHGESIIVEASKGASAHFSEVKFPQLLRLSNFRGLR